MPLAASWFCLTGRPKAWLARRVGADTDAVAGLARELGPARGYAMWLTQERRDAPATTVQTRQVYSARRQGLGGAGFRIEPTKPWTR